MFNAFTLFDLPETFELLEADLERAYFKAQSRFHPDRFIGKSEAERAQAVQMSADLNQGYQVLKDPLQRAAHLLSLQGLDVLTDSQTLQSPDLLMEIIEKREALEEIQSPEEAAQFQSQTIKDIESAQVDLTQAFEAENYPQAQTAYYRYKYLTSLLEDIKRVA